ncbi:MULTISPECIES: hypothetical protein [unclassified Rathayibacter]|uniref:hypothetical protein n=1 Tax=unclassified Rathayibacter TaxID=2609250 RepID=UPI0006F592C1|nr:MULTISPECIES: hypothetical protein [unclassified Rathayibacter]KQQ05950.1 hypothetical protein ASF42_05270 [Rathayibacter sp. Leaf294]KQS13807.1 hypothetical protein ASG06_05280 [Rathayibacter sp. Leaf185]
MTTEFLRDGLFVTAWFGLMTCVWLGWAQEAPPKRAPALLGIGSVIGIAAAVGGGLLVWRSWDTPSALDGQYAWFGVLVAAEVVLAGVACAILAARGLKRWFAAGVAVVVAAHFVPLGVMLRDPALVVFGVVQLALVVAAVIVARRRGATPSFAIGVTMGTSLLLAALVSAVRWVPAGLEGAL